MKPLLVTLLYGAAGVAVGLGGYLMQRLLSPKAPSSSPDAQTPYECGETPVGSAWQSWRWPFLPLATILLLLEAEVLFALPWVWVQKSLSPGMALAELILLVGPIGAVYAYLLRSGYLFPKPLPPRAAHPLPPIYQALQDHLLQQRRIAPSPSDSSVRPERRNSKSVSGPAPR